MKRFIVDTDIGADCDDVIALFYLLKKMKKDECKVEAITLTTTRKFASSAVKNILIKSPFPNIRIGEYKGKALKCDSFDHYSRNVAENVSYKAPDAVNVIRNVLASSPDKIDLICIGPLTNLALLMKSETDDISNKDGLALIKEKVGKAYIMGGSFDFGGGAPFAEWNFEQDLDAAKYVLSNFPNEIILCPAETGSMVQTYRKNAKNICKTAMDSFFQSLKDGGNNQEFDSRPSWDPLTCMVALNENDFIFSPKGFTTFLENGITEFHEDANGNTRYLLMNNDFKKTEEELNALLLEGSL